MFDMFWVGFSAILEPIALILILVGVVVGIVFGAVPGLTGTMAVAICVPLTYTMQPIQGIAFLIGLYIGSCSGGLISAILLNIPGTLSSIATTFDGAPMAKKGQAGKALGAGIVFSFLGGMFSFLILFFIAPPIADIAVQFGPIEYFSIALFALTLVSSVSGHSLLKGLLSALLGIAISLVGISPIDGLPRYTYGMSELNAGFALLPTLIGIFAVSELLKTAREGLPDEAHTISDYKIKGFGFSLRELKEQLSNFVRSSLIGTAIGILPGIGGSTSNLLAYITAKNRSKHPEKFGTGILDGVVASESANNASIGGSLVPLLTLGIPGDGVTAMLLGALMIHGLTPGPLLFTTNGDLIYGIFAALIVANLFMLMVEFCGIRVFVQILRVPKYILMPVIMVLCAVGTFGNNNRLFDVWVTLVFGIVGYLLSRFEYPLTPVILGFVLGSMAELNFRRGMMLTQGSLLPFLTKPISAVFLLAALLSVALSIYKRTKKSNAQR